ncbi:hypothetical protein D3C87_1456060 [compost metagenome]
MPSAALAPASSSAPSGAPWTFSVPAFLGAPKPMVVLAAIRVGLSVEALASRRAFSMAAWSWPSISMVFQPTALKRAI